MQYFVFLTQTCNFKCKYCGGSIENYTTPTEIEYDIDYLSSFINKDPDDEKVICFYGGEPCLRPELMERMIKELPASKFVLQTNGTKLNKLSDYCIKNLDTILISIDGYTGLNDSNRGEGNHDAVLKNSTLIREKGFTGDLIARMTVTEATKIDKEVRYLLEMDNPVKFDHVHWQLDVFWTEDNHWKDLEKWVEKNYNPRIGRLVDYWIECIEKNNQILGIVPFQGVLKRVLSGNTARLPCGAGIDFFAINTSGLITACPICPEWEIFHLGHISKINPDALRDSLLIGGPCPDCDVYGICGGRCLFANKTNLWGKEEFDLVCSTVKHLVNEITRIQPHLLKLISSGVISIEDFNYPEFNNSCEIIP